MANTWVVLATYSNDNGQTWDCEVFAEGFATEEEAVLAADAMIQNLGVSFEQEQQGSLEVCTAADAVNCVN